MRLYQSSNSIFIAKSEESLKNAIVKGSRFLRSTVTVPKGNWGESKAVKDISES